MNSLRSFYELPDYRCHGHVIEDESLFDFLDSSYRARDHQLSWDRLFPSLDFHHIGGHTTRNKKSFGGGRRIGPKEWMEFVEVANIQYAVLFPTKGLRIGNISHPDWACYVARAYNNWLHERYLKQSPRLKGMALLPLQRGQLWGASLNENTNIRGYL